MYIATNEDKRLVLQKNKRYKIAIEVLNSTWQVIGTVEGYTKSFNMSYDADSEIRRTVSIDINITENTIVSPENLVWLTHYAKVNIGVYDYRYQEYKWYKLGRYVITQYDYFVSSNESSIKLDLVDLMAIFTEDRGNQITTKSAIPIEINYYPCPVCGGEMKHTYSSAKQRIEENGIYTHVIIEDHLYRCPKCNYRTGIKPEASITYPDISNAIKLTVNRFSTLPYNRFSMCKLQPETGTVPYDLEYNIGDYPIQIIKDLRELYPNYETYFDEDGVFVFSKIPTTNEDEIILDKDIMDQILISEDRNANFGDVCNIHDIWGQEITAERTADSTSSNLYGDTIFYYVNVDNITTLNEDKTYCFIPDRNNLDNTFITLQTVGTHTTNTPMKVYKRNGANEDIPIKAGDLKAGMPYVIKTLTYYENSSIKHKCILYGESQIRGVTITVSQEPSNEQKEKYQTYFSTNNIYYNVDPDNAFGADLIQPRIKSLNEGEYNNIYTTELTYERGRYENYKTTRLNHNITLTTLIVPWLDVNKIIRYTSPVDNKPLQAIIKKIDFDYAAGTMTITAIEFYPFYPTT